jgi:glycosyltransferase involved in cell wall biosynthesis
MAKLLIVTGIFPPDHGGPASYVPAIAMALAQHDDKILAVVTLSDSLVHDDSSYPFTVRRLARAKPWWQRAWNAVAEIRRFAKQADVVYLNGLVLEGVIACRLLSRRPVVVKVVGDLIWERARNQRAYAGRLDDFQSAKLSWKWQFLRALQSWYTARAALVICPSRYLADIVAGWGVSRERIRVIYNAVRPPRDAAGMEPEFDIVTAARLVPWKGIAELIRVAAAGHWSLKVVGDGPLREELETTAHQLGAHVHFTGHVESVEVATHIRSGRVFVLNSTYEGLPHIVLEAKLAGVPVIATAAGGTPEVVGAPDAGVLVPTGDLERLAAELSRLLADGALRATIVASSFRQIEKDFSYERMVEQTADALAACVNP